MCIAKICLAKRGENMHEFHQPRKSMGRHSYHIQTYDNVNHTFHLHKGHEIVYVMDGKAICSVNGKTKVIEKGEFVLFFSNEIHSIKSIGEVKIWIGVFSEDFICEFSKFQKGKSGVDFSFRCSDNVLQYLSDHLIKEEVSDVYVTKSCLYALCSEYLRQISLEECDSKQMLLMEKIVKYIDKNYKRSISLATLAESLDYEYYYFSKLFNRLFSMPFNDYLNIYRFNEACRMLVESDMPIATIAQESGFQSIRSFNNSFKKLAGVSPCEYRGLR